MSSITIDDTDPSIEVNWDAWWRTHNNKNAFMGSLTRTDMNGASAVISFKGTSIQVFGAIIDGTGSSYRIDDSPPVTFQRTLDTDTGPYKVFKQLFYTSPELPDGYHTLVVTNLSGELVLDFMVIESAPPPPPPAALVASSVAPLTVTTKVLTRIVSVFSQKTTTTSATIPAVPPSSHPATNNATTTITPVYRTTFPSSLATSSSSIQGPGPSNSMVLPSPAAASESHGNPFPTAAIIGLAVGSSVAVVSLLLLIYIWRRRKKQQRHLIMPNPFPPVYSSHSPPKQSSPTPSTPSPSPPFLSEKPQLRALEDGKDSAGDRIEELARGGGEGLSAPQRNTIYSSHPSNQNEQGQNAMVVLSPLRYSGPLAPASDSTVSFTPTGPENPAGPSRSKPKVDRLRTSLLPLQDRVFTPTYGQQSPSPKAVSITAGADGSTGASSAMGFPNSNSLHQRTSSLSVPDGRVADRYDGSGDSGGVGRSVGTSVFDELPPYPGTARWSRRFGI